MAFVLSSLSGNLISAASAGYAPTNSGDVSAIASAYQVVSATATQLNAGTAYLTSVNETPISAARAGNAANASLANSAWYDGTGRLISALPDEATVSGIASAYAESAASSKLDESATANFYPTSNPSGFISGVDLSDYATTADLANKLDTTAQVVTAVSTATSDVGGYTYTWVLGINGTSISAMTSDVAGVASTANYDSDGRKLTALAASSSLANYQTTANMSSYLPFSAINADANSAITSINGSSIGGGVDSATVSAIASAYAESAASSKQDTLTFGYNTADQISSIDGSALGGMDESAVSAIASAYAESAVSGKADSSALSSYALSADVSGTVDLVSTQSANWGGSALALSAGPGVSLTLSGNTLVASTDETVLWSGTPVTVGAATAGLTLTESPYNFERVALYWVPWNYTVNSLEKQETVAEARITSAIPRIGSVAEWNVEGSNTMFLFILNAYFDASKFYTQAIKYFDIGGWTVNTQGTGSYITKVVGINRTAEA